MQAPPAFSAADRVVRGLGRERDALVRQVVDEAGTLDAYGRLNHAEATDFAETVGGGLDAVLAAISEHRSFRDDDVSFLWPHIRRRTEAGVSEGDMMAVVRIFQRVLWDAIVELAGDDDEGRTVALILARPLIDYVDVLSDTVNKAYIEAGEAIASHARTVRAEVVDLLLTGAPLPPGAALNAARIAGLDERAQLIVIVARRTAPGGDHMSLRVAATSLSRAAGSTSEPLAAVREGEVVVVAPVREQDKQLVARGLETAHGRLVERGIPLAIGASTIREGVRDVPAGYAEACIALEQVRASGGVLALNAMNVLDYLILRAGDRTAWRLLPATVRAFVEDDSGEGSVLSDTLLAYVACDLSVKLAAEQLFVHPNTAHYRLAKIEDRTGCDVRKLADVQLLTIAIRLHRDAAPARL
jgi:hypothetical protein